jgi:hypothetical protein
MQEKLNPWSPLTDPVQLKVIGKALEETNELGNALARVLIQGIDECEPTTGKPNREWLEDEGADVMATLGLVIERFGLDYNRMMQRSLDKAERLQTWFEMPVKEV